MGECIECRSRVHNNEAVCRNCLDVQAELMAMLQEPTYKKVRADQFEADALMRNVSRALAPSFNKILAELAEKIAASKDSKS